LKGVPLEQIAIPYSKFAGKTVSVAERARRTQISLTVTAATDEQIVPLIEAQLRAQGIAVISTGPGITLDFALPVTPAPSGATAAR
jgi:hypothetical protein